MSKRPSQPPKLSSLLAKRRHLGVEHRGLGFGAVGKFEEFSRRGHGAKMPAPAKTVKVPGKPPLVADRVRVVEPRKEQK